MSDVLIQPQPRTEDERARWRCTSRRRRMLEGTWREDAYEKEATFYAPELRNHLPQAEISGNPFKSVISQIAILYKSFPAATCTPPPDPDDLEKVITPTLWPTMQRRNRYDQGLNECLIRVDYSPDGNEIRYRIVYPDMVAEVVPSKANPSQAAALEECRIRDNPVTGEKQWTWEVWDVRDPENPIFRIEIEVEGANEKGESVKTRLDVTADYSQDREDIPEERRGYPYWTRGYTAPIFPYRVYHRMVADSMFSPYEGEELVDGTLTTSCKRTWNLFGSRDCAHPTKVLIDGTPITHGVTGGDGRTEYVVAGPNVILQVSSVTGKTAQATQWNPAVSPKDLAEETAAYEAGLAEHAGLSAADIQRGSSSSSSGYSIVVSRQGLREVQEGQIPTATMGDQEVLALASSLANAYMGTALPEDPMAWKIQYTRLPRSIDEIKAELEEIDLLTSRGFMHPVDAFIRLNPGYTREEAEAKMREIAEYKRARTAPPSQRPPPTPPTNPTETDDAEEEAQDEESEDDGEDVTDE